MTTNRDRRPRRHTFDLFRRDTLDMFHTEFRLTEAEERQARFRAELRHERAGRFGRRGFRHRIGVAIVRVGRTVGGDAMGDALIDTQTTPAWLG